MINFYVLVKIFASTKTSTIYFKNFFNKNGYFNYLVTLFSDIPLHSFYAFAIATIVTVNFNENIPL